MSTLTFTRLLHSRQVLYLLALMVILCYGVFDTFTTIQFMEEERIKAENTNPVLDKALLIASSGYMVIPVDNEGKPYQVEGIVDGGWEGATLDEGLIGLWWTLWPYANIGYVHENGAHSFFWISEARESEIKENIIDASIKAAYGQESSGILKAALEKFGAGGFIAAKLLITIVIILVVIGITLYDQRLFPAAESVLLGISALGLMAGISNIIVAGGGNASMVFGVNPGVASMAILASCIIAGIILSYMPRKHDMIKF